MPTCVNCYRFVVLGQLNDVRLPRGQWAHKNCPPVSGGGFVSPSQISRLARDPSAYVRFLTTGSVPSDEDDD